MFKIYLVLCCRLLSLIRFRRSHVCLLFSCSAFCFTLSVRSPTLRMLRVLCPVCHIRTWRRIHIAPASQRPAPNKAVLPWQSHAIMRPQKFRAVAGGAAIVCTGSFRRTRSQEHACSCPRTAAVARTNTFGNAAAMCDDHQHLY